jgi:hypothetical protein
LRRHYRNHQLDLGANSLDLREHHGQDVVSVDRHHECIVRLHRAVELLSETCACTPHGVIERTHSHWAIKGRTAIPAMLFFDSFEASSWRRMTLQSLSSCQALQRCEYSSSSWSKSLNRSTSWLISTVVAVPMMSCASSRIFCVESMSSTSARIDFIDALIAATKDDISTKFFRLEEP